MIDGGIKIEPCLIATEDAGCNYHLGTHTCASGGATHLSAATASAGEETASTQVGCAMLVSKGALQDNMFADATIDIDDARHEVLIRDTPVAARVPSRMPAAQRSINRGIDTGRYYHHDALVDGDGARYLYLATANVRTLCPAEEAWSSTTVDVLCCCPR